MSRIWINIVTENQNAIEKAKNLTMAFVAELGLKEDVIIEKYSKFPNSYKIELEIDGLSAGNLNDQCLQITSRIAQPWTIFFDSDTNKIELIINKSAATQFTNKKYNVIKWANAGIIKM